MVGGKAVGSSVPLGGDVEPCASAIDETRSDTDGVTKGGDGERRVGSESEYTCSVRTALSVTIARSTGGSSEAEVGGRSSAIATQKP